MAAPTVAVSQTFAYSSAGTESHFSSNDFFTTIVVTNSTTSAVNVATDGGTAVAGATTHGLSVPPGASQAFGNLQSAVNANTTPGVDESLATKWTAQEGWQGTALTFASVIPQASTSGEITVSFQ